MHCKCIMKSRHDVRSLQSINYWLLLQMVPALQYSSLEALSGPHIDLLTLPSTLWGSLCTGLRACLATNNKQIMALTATLIIRLHAQLSKAGDYTCASQLFCSIAQAAEQAASVRHCEAIWKPCLPVVKSLTDQLPHTCMYHTEGLLEDVAEAFCELLSLCIEGRHPSLQQSFIQTMGIEDVMKWWHSWLARSKLARVSLVPCLLPHWHACLLLYPPVVIKCAAFSMCNKRRGILHIHQFMVKQDNCLMVCP